MWCPLVVGTTCESCTPTSGQLLGRKWYWSLSNKLTTKKAEDARIYFVSCSRHLLCCCTVVDTASWECQVSLHVLLSIGGGTCWREIRLEKVLNEYTPFGRSGKKRRKLESGSGFLACSRWRCTSCFRILAFKSSGDPAMHSHFI